MLNLLNVWSQPSFFITFDFPKNKVNIFVSGTTSLIKSYHKIADSLDLKEIYRDARNIYLNLPTLIDIS